MIKIRIYNHLYLIQGIRVIQSKENINEDMMELSKKINEINLLINQNLSELIRFQCYIIKAPKIDKEAYECAYKIAEIWRQLQPLRPMLNAYYAEEDAVMIDCKLKELFEEWDGFLEAATSTEPCEYIQNLIQ